MNVIDFLMIFVIAVTIRSGVRAGIVAEVFRLIGILCTIFVVLHYYVGFADVLRDQLFGEKIATEFLAFSILTIVLVVLFILISKGWVLVLKIDFHKRIDAYGGAVLSLVRSYFVCGLIFFALALAQHQNASPMVWQSASSRIFRYVAIDSYRATYAVLIEKFFPSKELAERAFDPVINKTKK
jgi:uncharacterized membrane protein required for colicin V production